MTRPSQPVDSRLHSTKRLGWPATKQSQAACFMTCRSGVFESPGEKAREQEDCNEESDWRDCTNSSEPDQPWASSFQVS